MTNRKDGGAAFLILFLPLLISGCKIEVRERAPALYRCSPEQYESVKEQHLFCSKETSYISSYCYDVAIQSFCDLRAEREKAGER